MTQYTSASASFKFTTLNRTVAVNQGVIKEAAIADSCVINKDTLEMKTVTGNIHGPQTPVHVWSTGTFPRNKATKDHFYSTNEIKLAHNDLMLIGLEKLNQ